MILTSRNISCRSKA